MLFSKHWAKKRDVMCLYVSVFVFACVCSWLQRCVCVCCYLMYEKVNVKNIFVMYRFSSEYVYLHSTKFSWLCVCVIVYVLILVWVY